MYFVTGLTYIYWFSNKSPSLARLLIELLTLPAIIANRNKQVLMSINDKLKPINDIFFMNTLFNQNIGFFLQNEDHRKSADASQKAVYFHLIKR
ncbi:hypothetical protein GEW_03312 [Pasteurella multocida subsp. gallicida str. Anand1_poultry]|nr:hypothetical protein GEW_03312 [Pasteurella multocida subsp. gallicida str. Anand1_poultry]